MQNAASVPKNSLVCAQIYEQFTNDGEWKVVNGEFERQHDARCVVNRPSACRLAS
jgi:hypothetical protein